MPSASDHAISENVVSIHLPQRKRSSGGVVAIRRWREHRHVHVIPQCEGFDSDFGTVSAELDSAAGCRVRERFDWHDSSFPGKSFKAPALPKKRGLIGLLGCGFLCGHLFLFLVRVERHWDSFHFQFTPTGLVSTRDFWGSTPQPPLKHAPHWDFQDVLWPSVWPLFAETKDQRNRL